MIMAAAFFCNQNTCALKLPCGLVSLTLLDVAAIVGLMPIGEKYLVGSFKDTIEPKIPNQLNGTAFYHSITVSPICMLCKVFCVISNNKQMFKP